MNLKGVNGTFDLGGTGNAAYSHAYIVWGGNYDGRIDFARRLAAAMICEGDGKKPCGKCAHCEKAARNIHPDIILIDLIDQKREIIVEQIRTLREDAVIMPNEAAKKVYIITNTMNIASQNALLKVLEEPPGGASFILCAQSPAELLPTVSSRCISVSVETLIPSETNDDTGIVNDFLSAQSDNLKLTEFSFKLEKMEKNKFIEFLTNAKAAVVQEVKNNYRNGTSSSQQEHLINTINVLDRAKAYTDFNVGLVHIAGFICAELYNRNEEQHD